MFQNVYKNVWIVLSICLLLLPTICVSTACVISNGKDSVRATEQTLRESLSTDQFTLVALLDEDTPMPSTSNKLIMFIDGSFYLDADSAVEDYVREQVEDGFPAAVFGNGYERLCLSVNADCDGLAEPGLNDIASYPDYSERDHSNPVLTGASGLKLRPEWTPGDMPSWSAYHVAGAQDNLVPLIDAMLGWAGTA